MICNANSAYFQFIVFLCYFRFIESILSNRETIRLLDAPDGPFRPGHKKFVQDKIFNAQQFTNSPFGACDVRRCASTPKKKFRFNLYYCIS